jgi:hypothetical protein
LQLEDKRTEHKDGRRKKTIRNANILEELEKDRMKN